MQIKHNMMLQMKKKGYSTLDIARIKQIIEEEEQRTAYEIEKKCIAYALVIPCHILATDYWPKTAKSRIKEFNDKQISVFESLYSDILSMDEIIQVYEEMTGTKVDELTERLLAKFKPKEV